ncbi:MAG TPA: gluconokinase [Jatrophihabitans sp.]|nr:gluconokinase [Jatrophihabitans sp.]
MEAGRRALSPLAGLACPPVLVLMGVSGSGKTTVARALGADLGWAVEEGDALHPPGNVKKMAAGVALTDADRAPWLQLVRRWIDERVAAGQGGIVTCSALKRRYRDVLHGPHIGFVHLSGTREQLLARVTRRTGHFMPASLLDSQLATLQPPGADECALTVQIDQPVDAQVAAIVAALPRRPA